MYADTQEIKCLQQFQLNFVQLYQIAKSDFLKMSVA